MEQNEFVSARQRYWQEMVKRYSNVEPRPEEEAPVETNVICFLQGPTPLFAVFEDDGVTGYLYLYNSEEQRVTRYLHLYDDAGELSVNPGDVRLLWSNDHSKCAVAIWGELRGIIDL